MISVFADDAIDFGGNGLCVLEPTSCQVNETLNGAWELLLSHPIDEWNKWTLLQDGNIIRAPVPAAISPRVKLLQSSEGRGIYRIQTSGGMLNLYSGPSISHPIIAKYKPGLDVQVLSTANASFYEVITPDGNHGWMASSSLSLQSTEETNAAATKLVVTSRQLRDQPFRIYRVVPDLTQFNVYARHLSYDLLDNMIYSYKPANGTAGSAVAEGIINGCESPHRFRMYSNITKHANDLSFENINPMEALLGDGGLMETVSGEMARDWYDLYAIKRVGKDTDIQIREGKNLLGVSYDVDDSNVVTRIVPTGETEDGEVLYMDPRYVDSARIGDYPHPRWIHLPVSEARVGDDMTAAQAKAMLLQAAQDEYEKGCDLPDVTINVEFINLADTEEYAQYKPLTDIFIGDGVWVLVQKIGLEIPLRMSEYTYDCMLNRYTKMTLGTVSATMANSTISPRQLPTGGINGTKLSMNSVGSGHLRALSVGSLQVKAASIDVAHINHATIDTLNANAITAVRATIQQLVAGEITADQLWADIATIAVAQLTTANIENAVISWADISNLAAAVADIAVAEIGTAHISFAQIFDLQADTAIIEKGIGGKFFFEELNILDANIVSLSAGQILVHGQDGSMYQLTVNEAGEVVPVLRHIVNDDMADLTLDASMKLVKSSITADCLNVGEIFAAEALIAAIKAGNIDAGAIQTSHISAGARAALLLDAQEVVDITAGGLMHEIANNAGQQMVLRFQTGSAWEFGQYQNKLVAFVTVWRNGLDVTEIVRPSAFHWERDSLDPVADAAWKALPEHNGVTTVTLTRTEIGDHCVLRCICDQAALFGTIEVDGDGVAYYVPYDGRPNEHFHLTPEGVLEGDGRYSIGVNGELIAEVFMDAMQVETTVFDHSVLKTSHVTIKDDRIDIVTGGTLNLQGADIKISAGGSMLLEAPDQLVIKAGTGAGAIGVANGKNIDGSTNGGYFLYAGSESPADAPFRVTMAGDVIATKIQQEYSQSFWDMADPDCPAEFPLYIPAGYRIDTVLFTFKIGKARTFAKGAKAGGGQTSSEGGAAEKTSRAGGGESVTSGQDGAGRNTKGSGEFDTGVPNVENTGSGGTGSTGSGSAHYHVITNHRHSYTMGATYTGYEQPGATNEGSHTHSGPSHTHSMQSHTHLVGAHVHGLNEHTHNVTVNAHTHILDIDAHTHTIEDHTHDLDYGINEKSTLATSCALKIGSTTIGTYSPNPTDPVELKSRLSAGWNTVLVQPNDDARISAYVLVKLTPIPA